MRNLSLLLGVVLLVHGVFGVDEVKSVSVMVGDSLTLNSDFTETKGDELQWKIEGESNIIAQIDREANKSSVPGNNEARFRGRLKLDHQTGSLTITNIRTTDSGEYELKIKDSMNENKYRFTVTVRDVFLVDTDGVKSVSVTDGDSVTLHTGVTGIQRDELILWKFGDQELNSPVDSRWKNIDLNDPTGELTIKNIRRDQSGDYKVEINSNSMILQRQFCMAVDEMKTVSVKEGESVTLRTGVIDLKIYDLILWKFKDQLIAKTIKLTNQMSLYDTSDEIFKGRLQLNEKTGSLSISDSRTTDSGDYHLNMTSSTHTIQRTIIVTVSDSRSSGAASGISGVSVVLMIWAVTVFLLEEV